MPRRTTNPRTRAVLVDSASGEAQKLPPVEISRMSEAKLADVLGEMGMMPKDGTMNLTSHVTLSARTPWIEAKGYLSALNPRTVFPDDPAMWFAPESGQPTGRLEIWLSGLDAGATYLARVEVASWGTSPFDVRAITLGAGVTLQTVSPPVGPQTLLLQFPSGDGGLGLIRIECADWGFYEAEVSRFDDGES